MGVPFLIAGAVALLAGVTAFVVWQLRGGGDARRQSLPLAGTMLMAAGALALVTGWLLAEPGTARAEALKSGGLAAGSVVALYALWLNDRRRRVDEDRHALESDRAEHDREKAADERFARAIELLGSSADQVRVGAVAALLAVARDRPKYYVQPVIDVLCAYLRRPFDHSRYQLQQREWSRQEAEEAERELQVRLSAQRAIGDLLPAASDADATRYDLDLTGAVLEYFRLIDRAVGTITLRYARLYSSNDFSGTVFLGDAWFTDAHSLEGRLPAQLLFKNVEFRRKAWFSGFTAAGRVLFTGARFVGDAKFSDASFGRVDFSGCHRDGAVIDPPRALDERG
ncbi:pentapeptide repeat-containing protein [Haloechinothrix salitolerans]|uniref:Pentapeptide repeat-containing protein n=1 Tax=Haloechinothrix salitolerans TaxID=926830 RepID=A0ABW2BS54_9PSEU